MTDSDKIFFDMAFVSILSFQFHPGNAHQMPDEASMHIEIDKAATVALVALRRRNIVHQYKET